MPVQPEDTVLADLEVQPINSTISGRAVAPDLTTPVPDVLVVARGNSPFGGDLNVETYTNALGEFELVVRAGTYEVTAALPPSELIARGWLNPSHLTDITVSAGSPSAGWDLPFRTLDGQIIGTVSFDPGISFDPTWMPTHPAYVWGRSADSDRAEIEAQVVTGTRTFTYAMPVLSGAMWHVGAVYEDRDNGLFYESSEVAVSVPSSTLVIQDLELKGPYPLPQPFIISFDGTQMQTIVLPDGVQLDIPGGALLTTGATSTAVTLFVLASDEKKPQPGEELVGPGYEIWAVDGDGMEIVQFNHNVTMTFSYPDDGTLELQDISEYQLIPVYYSTLEGHWIFPDSYEVDTANNEIAMNLLHF
nr:hypothetical protein [uncultured bacterium]